MDIIKEFQTIRDIHYRIPLTLTEVDHCCSGKAKMLKEFLEKNGFVVRYRVCKMKWDDQKIFEHLLNLPHNNDSSHVYLEVLVDGRFVKVDPTWDVGLKNIFDIAHWDGKNDTVLAVKSGEEYDIETSRKIMEETTDERILNDIKINGELYRGINEWLEKVRL